MNPGTIYRHIASGKFYKFLGYGRHVEVPSTSPWIIYKQLYASELRGTGIKLPYGSIWMRDPEEFSRKFEKYDGVM
jgi:hypothetical protein